MKEIALVMLGWILGLFSPLIVARINDGKKLKSISEALRIELDDLQYRLAVSSLSLVLRHGNLDADFLAWIKPIIARYAGNERSDSIKDLIEKLSSSDDQFDKIAADFFHAKPGVGSSVKVFKAAFLEAHLEDISMMSISLQRKIHEFRHQLTILNQEIELVEPRVLLTFNPSLGDNNIRRLSDDLDKRFIFIQQRCRYVAERIGSILRDL